MKVIIRPLKIEDAYTSVKWRNDAEVFKYTGTQYSHIITIEDELKWIKTALSNLSDYRCAIEVDGKYVGNIYLLETSTRIGHYNIFIGDREYWGKGVAKKASQQIIEIGFTILKLEKIVLRVRILNEKAYLLYKSLGFIEVSRDETWIEMEILNQLK